jgi:hypothetical protein
MTVANSEGRGHPVLPIIDCGGQLIVPYLCTEPFPSTRPSGILLQSITAHAPTKGPCSRIYENASPGTPRYRSTSRDSLFVTYPTRDCQCLPKTTHRHQNTLRQSLVHRHTAGLSRPPRCALPQNTAFTKTMPGSAARWVSIGGIQYLYLLLRPMIAEFMELRRDHKLHVGQITRISDPLL